MKKVLFLSIIALLFLDCSCKKVNETPVKIVETDTVFVERIDTVYVETSKTVEVIPSEYLEYKLIVLNVKHYVDITEARPANKTYFYGWIRRAMEGVPDLLSRDQQKFGQ